MITKSWARALTTEALAIDLERYADQPKGWVRTHRDALILEAAVRLHGFDDKLKKIEKAHNEYRQALKERRHGGVAQDTFYREVMNIMGWDE